MKIWSWTDRILFSTPERRKSTLSLFVQGFWIWQCIWIGVLFWQMTAAASYDGLFSLQSVLDSWNGSFLVCLLLQAVQGRVTLTGAVNGMDVSGLVLTGLLISAGLSRKEKLWTMVFAGLLILSGGTAASCFSAGSLQSVAGRLQILGYTGSAVIVCLLAISVYGFVKKTLNFPLSSR